MTSYHQIIGTKKNKGFLFSSVSRKKTYFLNNAMLEMFTKVKNTFGEL